jgi:2-dehydropantoate 2-reductase
MRILVYGAGNIGSLYAGLLRHAGHEVSILARGERLATIREVGIELEDSATGERTTARPRVVERLEPDDAYDFILVAMGREHVLEVLPVLAQNRTRSVLFLGNNAAGPKALVDALGTKRVLLGFPGAAGVPSDHAICYLILAKGDQPTTIGELDGSFSPRLRKIASALESARFPVAMCDQIDAWLRTHAAEILPTAYALYMAADDAQRLARTRDALVLMIRAIREGYRVLRAAGVAIVPRKHRIFEWLPEPILVAIAKRMVSDESATIKLGHGVAARQEMALLAADFAALAAKTSVETPALKRLAEYGDPAVEPITDGSHELRLRWRTA